MNQVVLFIHGLDKRDPSYALPLIKQIDPLVVNKKGVYYAQVYYGDIVQAAEDTLLKKLQSSPDWHKCHFKNVRPAINEFIMDSFQWYDETVNQEISNRVQESISLCHKYMDAVHLVLHSWGCVVALSDRSILPQILLPRAASITTMGCALHLADLGRERFPPVDTDKWTNFYHSMDLVGVPLNGVYGCTDIEVKDAGPLTEIVTDAGLIFTGMAHNCYWKSKTIAQHVASKIEEAIILNTKDVEI